MSISTANVTSSTANVFATSTSNTAITFLSLCNYSASNVTANVFIVPSGGSPGNLTLSVSNVLITTGDTFQFYAGNEKLVLDVNDSIQVNASANNAVAAVVSYTLV